MDDAAGQKYTAQPNITPRAGLHLAPELTKNLVLTSAPRPDPASVPARHVLVRIRAVSLNFRDLLVVADSAEYPIRTTAGICPCSDGAGYIDAAGPGSVWKQGDRVLLHVNAWLTGPRSDKLELPDAYGAGSTDGTLMQWKIVPDERIVRMPKNLEFEEAAALPTAYLTAANSLLHQPVDAVTGQVGRVRSGDTVLTMGTGGVSCGAIQIAAALGATVISTSSSAHKLELCRKLGATHVINYREHPRWEQEVLKVTNGRGVDHVIEVGGAGTIKQSLMAARAGGLVSQSGLLTESTKEDLIPLIVFGARTIRGVLAAGNREMLEELVAVVEEHDIRPLVGKTFEWEDARDAFEYCQKSSEAGKTVIKV